MTDVGMALATGCDCPQYPAEVERDCCCIGGTECIDGRVRASGLPATDVLSCASVASDQHASICTRTGFHLCIECRSAVPTREDGAVSAIADHSGPAKRATIPAADAGGGTDSTEPRRTVQGPPVEADGAARSSYLSGVAVRELRLMHALAVARLSLSDDPATFIEAACAVADLFPVMTCLGRGKTFVPVYRRQTKFCSDRCRYRIGMRNRRRRLAAEAVSPVTVSHEPAE